MSDHYGCFNRRPFKPYIGQDGWWTSGHERTAKAISIKPFGKKECQFTLSVLGASDKRCAGCTHKANKEPSILETK